MHEKLREEISKYLKQHSYTILHKKVEKEKVKVAKNTCDMSEIMAYISEKGYDYSESTIEMVGKLLSQQKAEESNDESNDSEQEYVFQDVIKFYDNVEDFSDEDIRMYLQYLLLQSSDNLLKALNETILNNDKEKNGKKQYAVEQIYDGRNGSVDTKQLSSVLNKYAANGWRLKSSFVNELGSNSTQARVGSFSSGTNSTIDQIVLIFEK